MFQHAADRAGATLPPRLIATTEGNRDGRHHARCPNDVPLDCDDVIRPASGELIAAGAAVAEKPVSARAMPVGTPPVRAVRPDVRQVEKPRDGQRRPADRDSRRQRRQHFGLAVILLAPVIAALPGYANRARARLGNVSGVDDHGRCPPRWGHLRQNFTPDRRKPLIVVARRPPAEAQQRRGLGRCEERGSAAPPSPRRGGARQRSGGRRAVGMAHPVFVARAFSSAATYRATRARRAPSGQARFTATPPFSYKLRTGHVM